MLDRSPFGFLVRRTSGEVIRHIPACSAPIQRALEILGEHARHGPRNPNPYLDKLMVVRRAMLDQIVTTAVGDVANDHAYGADVVLVLSENKNEHEPYALRLPELLLCANRLCGYTPREALRRVITGGRMREIGESSGPAVQALLSAAPERVFGGPASTTSTAILLDYPFRRLPDSERLPASACEEWCKRRLRILSDVSARLSPDIAFWTCLDEREPLAEFTRRDLIIVAHALEGDLTSANSVARTSKGLDLFLSIAGGADSSDTFYPRTLDLSMCFGRRFMSREALLTSGDILIGPPGFMSFPTLFLGIEELLTAEQTRTLLGAPDFSFFSDVGLATSRYRIVALQATQALERHLERIS